jgi:hypothetical protein
VPECTSEITRLREQTPASHDSAQDALDVQTVADFLIADNCQLYLQEHVKTWSENLSAGHNALRLPTLQNTPESAAQYFEVLRSRDLPTRSLELNNEKGLNLPVFRVYF